MSHFTFYDVKYLDDNHEIIPFFYCLDPAYTNNDEAYLLVNLLVKFD